MSKTASKILSLVLVLVMAAALLSACGGSAGPEGTYGIKSMDYGDTTLDYDTLKSFAALAGVDIDDLFRLELQAGGKALLIADGDESEGTYTVSGNTVSITFDGETVDAQLDGNTLTMEEDGAKMVFEKK
ncbi:MAG: lipocalin family protein [Oscillospiraceae bacterium]|nr:lipocalin family protein [Oscillospiraceae bacterium]